MLKRILFSCLFFSAIALADTKEITTDESPKELYSIFSYKGDVPSYMDFVEPLANLIGSPVPTSEKEDSMYILYKRKEYIDYFNENTNFKASYDFGNAIYYHGNVDYLSRLVLEPNDYYARKDTKNFKIELEYGRGKVYAASLRAESPLYSMSFSDDKSSLSERHAEYINKYLEENGWKHVSWFVEFFNAKHVFEKDNKRITYWASYGYPVYMKIERTDLQDQNEELEKIHKEAKAIDDARKEQIEKERFN